MKLSDLAHARSGDKGNHANIGVVANDAAAFEILRRDLTADRVHEFFGGLGVTRVERFELPRIGALNFVLYDALAGGASQSLRIDTQGKLLGTAILELELAGLLTPDSLPSTSDLYLRCPSSKSTFTSTPAHWCSTAPTSGMRSRAS